MAQLSCSLQAPRHTCQDHRDPPDKAVHPRRTPMSTGKRRSASYAFGLFALLILWATPSLAQPSQAQSWPQRPVKLILPLGPGSGADTSARLLADRLAARWGQSVVVENRPGADGVIAITAFI